MEQENKVLCASSAYDKKYFFNDEFDKLPSSIQDELHIMAVLFTEDVGGIFVVEFTPEGELVLKTEADEGDLLFDDIGAGLKIRKLQMDKRETFEALEMFYKVFFLGESIE